MAEKKYTKEGDWLYTIYSKEETKQRVKDFNNRVTNVFPPSWAIYGICILGFIVLLFREVFN